MAELRDMIVIGDIDFPKKLTIVNNASIDESLDVAKSTYIKQNIAIDNNTSASGTLKIAGASTFNGNISVSSYQIKGDNGGSWISSRDRAIIRNKNNEDFSPVIYSKTTSGDWSIGSVFNSDSIYFSHSYDSNYTSKVNTVNKVAISNTGEFSGNSATATNARNAYTAGVSNTTSNYERLETSSYSSWGNTTGTSFTTWGVSDNNSTIDFRQNNPSGGKMSIKVNGRFYVNEGNNPVLSSVQGEGDYWGLCIPDGDAAQYVRTTSLGIIPYQSGTTNDGHNYIGTSTWYFNNGYFTNLHATTPRINGKAISIL